MSTVGKILGSIPPTVNPTAYPQHLNNTIKAIDPDLVYGVELEIEGVPHWPDLVVTGMSSVADGSLRNNGREFLLMPSKYQDAYATLTEFFSRAKLNDTNYSDRTSIHVHTNCQDLKIDELQTVLFLYQAVESLVFNWVNPSRADNIFCVPWSQTNLSFQIFDGKRDLRKFQNWAKYTALNLLPLYEYGTIEWRHMHGHCDMNVLSKWLQIIGCFFRYARNNPIGEVKEMLLSLNTTSLYNRFIDSVFQEHVDFIYTQPDWQIQLEEGLLMLKYAVSLDASPKKEKVKVTAPDTLIFDDVLQNPEALGQVEVVAAPRFNAAEAMDRMLRERVMEQELERARRMTAQIQDLRRTAPGNPWPPANPRRNNNGNR